MHYMEKRLACPKVRVLPTGLTTCYDQQGKGISCPGSGQDADRPAAHLFTSRFTIVSSGLVQDNLTGLLWYPQVNAHDFPLTFAEAQDAVMAMNQSKTLGRSDWRVPARSELRSILSHGHKNPALPMDHPFTHVFLGRYWTSTDFSGLPDHAWYVHLEGARVFYERKDRYCLVWPVAGNSSMLSWSRGNEVDLPKERFVRQPENIIVDQWTGLSWLAQPLRDGGSEQSGIVAWSRALSLVGELAQATGLAWRLPDINELESLVDLSRAYPALSAGHPFTHLGDGFWSSTSSGYDPAWAYVLYLGKGAVGVGFKINADFLAWPVLRPSCPK